VGSGRRYFSGFSEGLERSGDYSSKFRSLKAIIIFVVAIGVAGIGGILMGNSAAPTE